MKTELNVVEQLKRSVRMLSDDEFVKLSTLETLLSTLVKDKKHSISIKKLALVELGRINKRQMQILGQ